MIQRIIPIKVFPPIVETINEINKEVTVIIRQTLHLLCFNLYVNKVSNDIIKPENMKNIINWEEIS